MSKETSRINCTYDQAMAYRDNLIHNLLGGTSFFPDKWAEVREKHIEYEAVINAQVKHENKLIVADNVILCIAVLISAWIGVLKGRDFAGIAILLSVMLAVVIRRKFFRKSFKHQLSAFSWSDFQPVKLADYEEVWQIASEDQAGLDYITKALAHRGELLNIELVNLRHQNFERRNAEKLALGAKTKALLSSSDPKVAEFLSEQLAAVEFYRSNPTVALIDRRRGASSADASAANQSD